MRRRRRPTLVVDFTVSGRLLWLWSGWCLLTGVAVLAGVGAPWPVRLVLTAATAWLWRCGWRWLRGAGGNGRLTRDPDGRWWLGPPGAAPGNSQLARMPHRLGPWLWLHFRDAAGSHLTVLDSHTAEPVGLCRLQVALKLEARVLENEVRDAGRTGC